MEINERKAVAEIVLCKVRQALDPEITIDESQEILMDMVDELADQCDFKNELSDLLEEI